MFFNDWKSFFAWILRNGKVKVALLIVVFDSLFLAYPSVFQWMAPDPIHYFRLTSLALLILNTGLLWIWREIRFDISDASSDTYSGEGFPEKSGEAFREVSGMAAREAIPKKKGIKIDREWIWRYGGMGISLVITLWIAVYSIEGWLQRMARIPIDPQLADMLPAIQAGLDSLFEGRNPYHAYHDIASWEIRFIYGPGLWGPFIIPYLLGIDLRYITLIGGMGVPVLLLVYTIVWSRFVKDVGLLAILFLTAFTLCNNHATTMFFPVAHTFVYWPLFPIFCYTFLTERHRMSTLLLGWLVLCRTTMISLVPIYFIYLFKTKRTSLWNHLGLWILAVGLPMLPFLILDPHTLLHNMIFHYTTVIKHYAWNTPGVMDVSFGLTPILVQCHLQRFVGLAQGILLLGFYLMVFWKMNNRDQWLMSMPYALLLFSFTTIWPVVYLFLDVFLFMTSVILVTMRWKAEKSIALSKVYAISLGFIVGIAIFSTYIKSIE